MHDRLMTVGIVKFFKAEKGWGVLVGDSSESLKKRSKLKRTYRGSIKVWYKAYAFCMRGPKNWTSSDADEPSTELSVEAAASMNAASQNLANLMKEAQRVADALDEEIRTAIAAGLSLPAIRAQTHLGRNVIEAVMDGKSSLTAL